MSTDREEELALTKRAAEGDFEAFEELVNRTEGKLFGHLARMVQSPDDARELLQETYLSAYKNIKSFKGNSSFSTWVYRIATNNALMYFRKKKPESVVEELDIPTHEELRKRAISDWDIDPEREAHKLEVRNILDRAIGKLPPTYRVVLILRDIEGMSTSETANILDINEGAVKTRLHRARIHLRELLTVHFGHEELLSVEGAGK